MSKRVLVVLSIAVVAAGAAVLYIIHSGKNEPFRPPSDVTDSRTALSRLLETDVELKALSSRVEVSPTDPSARAAYGAALLERGLFVHAKEELTEAVTLDPGNSRAHRDLGTALSETDDLDSAIYHWQEAVRLDPLDPTAHNNLGNGLLKAKRVTEAIAEWRSAVALDPLFAPTRVNLGVALLSADSTDAALEQLTIAGSLDSTLASVPYAMATVWGARGNADSTVYYLEKGLDLSPESFRKVTGDRVFNSVKLDPRFVDLVRKYEESMRMRGTLTEK